MWHPFAGFSGTVLGALIFVGLYLLLYFTKEFEVYNLDPKDKPGAFEPFLARYLRASEFVIGLATGSIVLLIGSSALHGQSGHLPWVYASPLLLLSWCVLYGVVFMVWLILHYKAISTAILTRARHTLSAKRSGSAHCSASRSDMSG